MLAYYDNVLYCYRLNFTFCNTLGIQQKSEPDYRLECSSPGGAKECNECKLIH